MARLWKEAPPYFKNYIFSILPQRLEKVNAFPVFSLLPPTLTVNR
jgi:hypothetical protein